MTPPRILGLDMSSTTIGWVVLTDKVFTHGLIVLESNDIAERCAQAADQITILTARTNPDAIAIESPVSRFAKSMIPQCCIRGVVLGHIGRVGYAYLDVTPGQAKKALTGDGAATKEEMIRDAALWLGKGQELCTKPVNKTTLGAFVVPPAPGVWQLVYTEHEADALGVALAARPRVRVVSTGVVKTLKKAA